MSKYVLLICSIMYAMGVCVTSGIINWYYLAAILIFAAVVMPLLLFMQKAELRISIAFYLFFILGMICALYAKCDGYKLKEYADQKQRISCTVVDVKNTNAYTVLTAKVNTINDKKASGKISVTVENAGRAYTYGDEVSFITRLKLPQAPEFEGDIDKRIYCLSRGINAGGFVKGDMVEYLGSSVKYTDIFYWGYKIRDNIKKSIYKLLPKEQAGLLLAIMFSDKAGLTDSMVEDSQKAGISHTMATSGLHVSIMLMAFTFIIGGISRHYRISAGIGIFALILLFFVIGYTPSISRAILMSIMMLSACFFDRRSETLTALGFSALIILLFRPFALFDVGFILSYASVLGIVLIGSRMQYRFEKIRFKILNMVITTFCALLGTSIFTAHFFQRVTLFGALSNLLIIPLVTLLLPLGFLAGILGWMYMPLGRLLSYSLYVLLIGFEYIARLGSALPLAFANLPRPTAEVVIIYFGFCYLLFSAVNYYGGRRNV